MDQATVRTQMKTLYEKARAARKAGNAVAALSFRQGARRLQRKLKAAARVAAAGSSKKATEAESVPAAEAEESAPEETASAE